MSDHSDQDTESIFQCQFCDKTFKTRSGYWKHTKSKGCLTHEQITKMSEELKMRDSRLNLLHIFYSFKSIYVPFPLLETVVSTFGNIVGSLVSTFGNGCFHFWKQSHNHSGFFSPDFSEKITFFWGKKKLQNP